jgi:hypothetical protein
LTRPKKIFLPFTKLPAMLRYLYFVCLFAVVVFITSGFNKPTHPKHGWTKLFNGKSLNGWDTYIGPGFDSAGNQLHTQPKGPNNDPNRVFSIVTTDGGNAIRISGEEFGAITSKNEYENFHLHLMFRWGKNTWGPKKGKKMDSGLLYFCVGPDGADYGYWKRSQEFQIEEGNVGDYWGVAGGFEDVPADKKNDSQYVYNPAGKLTTFSAHTPLGRRCIKRGDAENPTGEWNTVDLYCHGDTSVHVVNGKVMMVLYHSRQWDNGAASPLAKGKLQIQSEGAEVYYKDIKVRGIGRIPADMLQ